MDKVIDFKPIKSIYHVAIMPCYDKKLEAVRPELKIIL